MGRLLKRNSRYEQQEIVEEERTSGKEASFNDPLANVSSLDL